MAKKKSKKKKTERIPAEKATPEQGRLQGIKVGHPDLYKRASKRVGLTDVQIASYPDAVALKQALDGIHPASNPDAEVKHGKVLAPHTFTDGMPDKIEFESKLEARLSLTNRDHFDRGNLQAKLRLMNRMHGTQKPVRIVTDKNCKTVQGKNDKNQTARMLITKFTVYYK